MNLASYIHLMRFNKPIGIFLLWFPTAWALWATRHGIPSIKLLLLFFIGTVLMRAAGCVINDIADREIDRYVSRTATRPLTSGRISLKEALLILALLLMTALVILFMLPPICFYYAVFAVLVTFIYPFCKRYIQAPQAVLGIAFSMGIPMAVAASEMNLSGSFFILMMINFLWIVSYDTIYAMADKADDLLIGVKSTAIFFGDYDRFIIALLQISFHFLWLMWGTVNEMSLLFYVFWVFAGYLLYYQQRLIKQRHPEECFKAFMSNGYYGLIMWLALIFGF
ncbi:4-hydroxybenzoate octaprenyltransferase [Legionella israelensis]|uniref:4-hydroxybenzoate octaprenyltransferase n=1 Tax=Legionella israelensis TaxID=454 RepID=A0A0W0VL88_9GAMM|nr:4-hydroxybenzoate octaprenyltransferase [Legionella israelensis]KTD20855.1 4-hydroxybenzoate-octaprenyltransferase [Legionella israelensis]QBR84228.1 4-hydroxybenzoate octaprenyltransferase [Legionella israelensis]QBS08489.1 4-hydroxybenzoate octaprenyltransferase [Legionella israelensis]SCY27091.1 4-hydroxybenzoate polyprenyltransferase [Legionella israelensis DSM 19235]STX58137.1 4-hydroxybenzoate-octaprenyltransferase [Legionella israelensis]